MPILPSNLTSLFRRSLRTGARTAALALLTFAASARADALSKSVEIDFYRDSSSRHLKGIATRSDGRIIAGPVFTDLKGPILADLLWTLVPQGENRWLVGTGPDGRILEVTIDPRASTYRSETFAKVDDGQVFALATLPGGRVLAGVSPNGGIYLLEKDKALARVVLPADTVLDICLLDERTALVATGNPGRIYRIDLERFAAGGVNLEKITDAQKLEEKGIRLFGEVRDRNIRRLVLHPDGRVIAGSSPKGNLYAFARSGGAPLILHENRDAEVTDIVVTPAGDLFASFVFSTTAGTSRINRPATPTTVGMTEKEPPTPPPAETGVPERFAGRSSLVWFPAGGGFPETLISRSGVAFYRLVKRGDQLLIASGEQGDFLGYDIKERRSLTFPGSASTQLNGLATLDDHRLIALRNNASGLALVDFSAAESRELESRRLDIGTLAQLGAFRFGRLRDVSDADLTLSIKTNLGSDELEGWTDWTPLAAQDGGWQTQPGLRGRYLKFKLSIRPGVPAPFEIDKAQLHYLSQNRRPVLTDFRLFSPNFAIIPASVPAPPASTTLGQILGQAKEASEEKRRSVLLGSAVIPAPGNQIAYWTLNDPDGDSLAATFSLRRQGDEAWTDLAVASETPFVQFDTSSFSDGVYFTRLVVTEQAPRPAADRLTVRFETDDLIIDRTPPKLTQAQAQVRGDKLVITVTGTDSASLLEGAEFRFNHGLTETVEQPLDGIRDSRTETFVLELPLSRVAGATSAEVLLYDDHANSVSVRLSW
ncbi:MAG: hypothetical protein U1F61_00560 [Opitutaceae bacterium]